MTVLVVAKFKMMKKISALFTLLILPALITQAGTTETAKVGEKVVLTATADGSLPITYKWFRNSVEIFVGETLTIDSAKTTDAGVYHVVASNEAGSATSDTLELIVQQLVAPVFATQPTDKIAPAGAEVTFTASATGDPSPGYQWFKNGAAMSGQTQASLTLIALTENDAGQYYVVATNSAGSVTSNTVTFTLATAPVFATQPKNVTMPAGTTIQFVSSATGTPTPSYQWFKNGIAITGKTNAVMQLNSISTADEAKYHVVATNMAGTIQSNTVFLLIAYAPVIAQQPTDKTIKLNETTTLTVVANGIPTPTYQWSKDGTAITGATNASYTITQAKKTDAGKYTVTIKNNQGIVSSSAATVTVLYPPVFIQQPKATITALLGMPATIESIVDARPAPNFQWVKNGTPLVNQTSNILAFEKTYASDAGTYAVVASNSEGSVTSSNAALTVDAGQGPVIIAGLTDIAVPRNTRYTMTVRATGSGLTYKWYKGSMLLTGSTSSSLTIAKMQNKDVARYRCVVTDINGLKAETSGYVAIR